MDTPFLKVVMIPSILVFNHRGLTGGGETVIPLEVLASEQAAVLTCWSPNSPPLE